MREPSEVPAVSSDTNLVTPTLCIGILALSSVPRKSYSMFRGCTMRALHLSAPAARQHANRASHAHAQCTGAAQTAGFEFQDFTCSLKIIIKTLGRRGRRPELLKTCDHEEAGFTPSLGSLPGGYLRSLTTTTATVQNNVGAHYARPFHVRCSSN